MWSPSTAGISDVRMVGKWGGGGREMVAGAPFYMAKPVDLKAGLGCPQSCPVEGELHGQPAQNIGFR